MLMYSFILIYIFRVAVVVSGEGPKNCYFQKLLIQYSLCMLKHCFESRFVFLPSLGLSLPVFLPN